MTDTPLDRLNEYLDGDDPESVDLTGVPAEEIARQLLVAGVTRHLLTDADAATERTEYSGPPSVRNGLGITPIRS